MTSRKIATLPIKYKNSVKNPEDYNWEIPYQAHHPLRQPQPIFMNAIDGTPCVPIRSRQSHTVEHYSRPPPYVDDKPHHGIALLDNMKVDGLRALCKERNLKPNGTKRADYIAALTQK